jgi:uncharacterized protein YerC
MLKNLRCQAKKSVALMTMADKVEIIHFLKKGHSGKEIARRNGIRVATISDIKKNNESIQLFVSVLESEDGSSGRKQ